MIEVFNQFVYEDTFRGGTSVAFGDVDNDGVPDLITGPGDGGGPRLRVLSGRCLRNNQICGIADLFVGDPNFRGGITVSYVGGLNNWTERTITVDLSFLPKGKYNITIFKDGLNAGKDATDYAIEKKEVSNETQLKMSMAPAGGFVLKITK